MQKKKKNKKNDFFNSLKPILIFSFIINIVLLIYVYHLKTVNHLYIFAGNNEYLNVKSGVISLNNDINCLVGNNIEYNGEEDIKIKEIKIGYYILENENLNEIVTHYEKFEDNVSLRKTLDNITSLNISESNQKRQTFKTLNVKNVEQNLYIVMEVTPDDGDKIVSKLQLDISKIK